MHCNRWYAAIVPLTVAISFLTVSCGESKVSQCKKIVNVAYDAVSEAKTATTGHQARFPSTTLKIADTMDKAAKDMAAIELSDEKLKPYQSGFIKMYRETSIATRNLVGAFDKKDRPSASASLKNWQQATASEQELVTGLNSYCKSN